ncbi:response regulator [Desulfogranum japonicum]|uniref:response regulator n=1 Tax=Desulfogranum japonicum TaxID=231447 RepID=UPI0003F90E9E|nr:response regulator [Desulfogranum japonicum]
MDGKQEHILVVEDEIKIADVLRDYLARSGYQVTCVNRGDHVLERFQALSPSLILLDLMLPGMDGITICRELRRFTNIPIIMVTAKVEEVDRLVGLEIGADDYICKPFSPREVVARVKAVLRRTTMNEKKRKGVAGPIVIDEKAHTVSIHHELLALTPSEFGLLQVLVAAPGRVFSRSELINKVQGYQFEGYDRTVDSHIKNLRKKIAEKLPEQDVILTIYGLGYKLVI